LQKINILLWLALRVHWNQKVKTEK
jgi:hypothetical protein